MVNALSGITTECAPLGYVRELYDRYAPKFEHHLIHEFDYRVPEMMAHALTQIAAPSFGQALDLGCGTGLVAQALHPRLGACDGIDLSPKMLAIASKKGIYRSLFEDDVLSALRGPLAPGVKYDLVLAGDVFIYFGDISAILQDVHAAMQPTGLFAFSIETLETDNFALRPSGRYAHSEAYIRKTAADTGYAVESIAPMVIRKERGQSVPGMIFVLRRLVQVPGMIFVLRRLVQGSPECK